MERKELINGTIYVMRLTGERVMMLGSTNSSDRVCVRRSGICCKKGTENRLSSLDELEVSPIELDEQRPSGL